MLNKDESTHYKNNNLFNNVYLPSTCRNLRRQADLHFKFSSTHEHSSAIPLFIPRPCIILNFVLFYRCLSNP